MLYLVSAELHDYSLLNLPHEEFVLLVKNKVVPSLNQIVQLQVEGKILAGGVLAASQKLVFIVDLPTGESHLAVRRLLYGLPIFSHYRWETTPLESFQEWLAFVKG